MSMTKKFSLRLIYKKFDLRYNINKYIKKDLDLLLGLLLMMRIDCM